MQKPLGIQKCDLRTYGRTDVRTYRPTRQGVESRVRDLKCRRTQIDIILVSDPHVIEQCVRGRGRGTIQPPRSLLSTYVDAA